MHKKKKNVLFEMYQFDKEQNAFIIDVDLDAYSDLFNDWDFAPFRKKDIEPELQAYLEDCAEDIPLKYDLILRMHLPNAVHDLVKEKAVRAGVENYFRFMAVLEKKRIRLSRRKTMKYVLLAFVFLTFAYLIEVDMNRLELVSKILQEGILVGGWVFTWEAFSEVFFETREIRRVVKQYERFLSAELRFAYESIL